MSLLALLEEEDAEYISIDDFVDEIHKSIGEDVAKEKVIEAIMTMFRIEKDFSLPIIYTKREAQGWQAAYSGNLDYLNSVLKNKWLEVADDLPF